MVQIWCKYCVYKCKTIPVETIPGMGEVEVKKNGGGGEFKYNVFDTFKKLYKYHNISPPNITIKKSHLKKGERKK
jgi:hypothetical protein